MKFLKYIIASILLLISFNSMANYGCNVGNQIYPNATGGVNASGYPTYYASEPITIRWWDEDPNCGIRDNRISPRSNNEDKCQVNGVNWGTVYYFNPADNSCKPMNLPLDDYTWAILLVVGGIGAFYISKKGLLAA